MTSETCDFQDAPDGRCKAPAVHEILAPPDDCTVWTRWYSCALHLADMAPHGHLCGEGGCASAMSPEEFYTTHPVGMALRAKYGAHYGHECGAGCEEVKLV